MADAPLPEQDGGLMPLIWVNREAEYFLRRDWTTQITLIGLEKFDFTRKRRGGESGPWRARQPRRPRELRS